MATNKALVIKHGYQHDSINNEPWHGETLIAMVENDLLKLHTPGRKYSLALSRGELTELIEFFDKSEPADVTFASQELAKLARHQALGEEWQLDWSRVPYGDNYVTKNKEGFVYGYVAKPWRGRACWYPGDPNDMTHLPYDLIPEHVSWEVLHTRPGIVEETV